MIANYEMEISRTHIYIYITVVFLLLFLNELLLITIQNLKKPSTPVSATGPTF
jgi:hypothetical protein